MTVWYGLYGSNKFVIEDDVHGNIIELGSVRDVQNLISALQETIKTVEKKPISEPFPVQI